jgi:subtilase family serine protease
MCLLFVAVASLVPMSAQTLPPLTVLPGHVLKVLPQASLLPRAPDTGSQTLTFSVLLKLTDPAGFDAFSKDIEDPTSPNYRHTISVADFTARFGPSQAAYDAVLNFLLRNGFTLVSGSDNRRTITVSGTRAQVERTFNVRIDDYQQGDRKFHAISTEPALPASIAPLVAGIAGLSNLAQWRPSAAATPPTQPAVSYHGALTAAGDTNHGKSLPPGLGGEGQTVALIEYDNFYFSDLENWLADVGLPSDIASHVGAYAIDGGTPPSGCTPGGGCGETEVLLDIGGVLSIAQRADVIVFNAPIGDDFYDTINSTINAIEMYFPTAHTIVHTWLLCEAEISDSELANSESLIKAAAASGYTLFTSTGDSGGTCDDGSGNTFPGGISYPSDLPHAVAVGGTSLTLNSDWSIATESWWLNKGGFGVSAVFPKPGYQSALSVSGRSVPDVSIQAEPGIPVCQATSSKTPNCFGVGGTSLSAPFFAGIWALASQAQADSLFGVPWSPSGGYFYKIPGAFNRPSSMTGPGHDAYHVGLGSPVIDKLVAHAAAPVMVTDVNPDSGPAKGGTTVTLKGFGFVDVTKVTFGSSSATHLTVHSDTKLTVQTPAAPDDLVAITVSTPGGKSLPVFFSYLPEVTSVNPNTGPLEGGITVTVKGRALNAGDTFDFGGAAATDIKCSNSRTCTMTTPPHAPGKVAIVATNSTGSSSAANLFTYLDPAITGISPVVGPTTGGLTVGITGVSLKSGMTVTFGNVDATGVMCFSTTSCTVTSPAHAAGSVHLTATVDGIVSAKSSQTFQFVVFPTITSISPNTIPVNATASPVSTPLTITGTGFSTTAGQTVFNTGSAGFQNLKCTTTTTCTATFAAFPHALIMTSVDVTVTVKGNTSLSGMTFSYPMPPPPPPGCHGTSCF